MKRFFPVMLVLALFLSACSIGAKTEVGDGTDASVSTGSGESEGSLFQGAARRR